MKVEVYFDVVCPWCYVGERRFARALESAGLAGELEVVFRPFQLDPSAPTESLPTIEYLERRYGAMAASMRERVGRVAAEEGIEIDWSRSVLANTLEAHRLVRLAREEYDADVQRAVVEGLFAAHFERGQDVGDAATLARIGVEAGMDEARVNGYVASDEGRAELEAELERARAIGVRSVPTFVFEGRWAVEGAQPAEVFTQVLEEMAQRTAEGAGAASPED